MLGRGWWCLLPLLLFAGCGGDASDACAQAEQQVAGCLDDLCDGDDGAFCRCHAAGQHLVTDGGCSCEDGSYWDTVGEGVCDELDFEPDLDCKGLRATIRRFERAGACE